RESAAAAVAARRSAKSERCASAPPLTSGSELELDLGRANRRRARHEKARSFRGQQRQQRVRRVKSALAQSAQFCPTSETNPPGSVLAHGASQCPSVFTLGLALSRQTCPVSFAL